MPAGVNLGLQTSTMRLVPGIDAYFLVKVNA
jgi:hypothetical protein